VIVADCSVILPLVIPTTRTEAVRAVFDEDPAWAVPRLWRSEMRSSLRKHILYAALALDRALGAMSYAEALFHDAEADVDSGDMLRIVHRSRCSAYDAEYVALAQELGVRLVTDDQALVELFPEVAASPEQYLGAR
jgi:predicted nucleic acid-binding protein